MLGVPAPLAQMPGFVPSGCTLQVLLVVVALIGAERRQQQLSAAIPHANANSRIHRLLVEEK